MLRIVGQFTTVTVALIVVRYGLFWLWLSVSNRPTGDDYDLIDINYSGYD